ncbi:MAG: ABC transporter substrate-binding protein [Methanobacteriaceae archaeon]|jgi:iron complex transport system substrate-binding protein|nr:ABC transporter substrate-binding protein [Methanobacteriaceae archaeon]
MKKNQVIILCLSFLIIFAVGFHFLLSPEAIDREGNKNITDMANRTVQIPNDINSIIATSPPMTTMVYMLAPEKLKAVNFQWTDEELEYVPNEYKNLPVVGGWFGSQDGSYEEFIASEPDIIIESIDKGMGVDISTVEERQEKFGLIPVVAVEDSTNVSEIEGSIAFLGKILNKKEKSQELIDFNNKNLNKIKEVNKDIPEEDRKKVYYAESVDGLETDPSGSSHSQLISLCGGINVADTLMENETGTIQVTMEQVIAWNPEVIITTDTSFYSTVYNDPNWQHIDAVKNKEVYLSPQSPFKWFDRPPGANIIIGVPWTAKVIYPEHYEDLDLKEITKEFYKEFYHTDLEDKEAEKILTDSGIKKENL